MSYQSCGFLAVRRMQRYLGAAGNHRKDAMNARYLLCFIICLSAASRSLGAPGDTTVVVNTAPGILESTINGDATNNVRNNPARVYLLEANQIYVQNAPITVVNPTGTLIIAGAEGGRKPIILMSPVQGKAIAQNTVQGSIKLVNIHYQAMQTDGTQNNENWFMTTGPATQGGPNLPQVLTIDRCLFEFANIDLFECNGWKSGAKFFITNSYFRNMFHPGQWWGSRVFMCKNPVDTLWVENVTTTSGGLTFLMQNSLTRFAYLNHNTIVNNKKNWLQSQFYITFIVTNNIFINHAWAGEDTTIVYNEDSDRREFTTAINIDTTNSPGSKVLVQPQYYASADSTHYTSDVGLDRMRVFVSNNIHYEDTLMNRYYRNENNAYNTVGPYPVSYLNWFGFGKGPWAVHNVPGGWMNRRTQALFAAYPHGMIEDNTVAADPQTVTPGIKDATVADQMAKLDSYQWGDPHYPASANDITHSAYIFGDYDPTTLPGIVNGVKTENAGAGAGITKFTDLIENFSQSAHISALDNLPIGSLIWDDSLNAAYVPADDYGKIIARYTALGGTPDGVRGAPEVPHGCALSQNYPNPFNPTTMIRYSLPQRSAVTLVVVNTLGQHIATIVNESQGAGNYEVQFDGTGLASGVYFYRLRAGDAVLTKKLLLVR